MGRARRIAFAATLLGAAAPHIAAAQPAPPANSKLDAKALMASGVKLFNAKEYLAALLVFKDAYARFQSAKILLNIATTLAKLERPADAANAYQRYLDSSDADPTKHAEVQRVLADLDKTVGSIALTVTPADAEVQLGDDDDWRPASASKVLRVASAGAILRVRRVDYQPTERQAKAAPGKIESIAIALEAVPATTEKRQPEDDVSGISGRGGIRSTLAPESPRSQFGALVRGHIDPEHPGAAILAGATADFGSRLEVQAAAILGATFGAYGGASFSFLTGTIRPLVAAGVPVFFSHGARFAIRGAAGIELALNRHLAITAEVGVERLLNAEMNVAKTVFVPALGVSGRL